MQTKMSNLRSEFIAWYFNEFKFSNLFISMDGMAEESPWHREHSIGIHTNMVVTEYLARCGDFTILHLLGAFAAAFHDVGKPGSRERKFKPERGHYNAFHGHEQMSARLWEDWAVTNFAMLKTRFGFQVNDIYRVSWLIEYHKPWDLKKTDKLEALAKTAYVTVGFPTFARLLTADTWGRLSDDAPEKRAKVQAWIDELYKRCDPRDPAIEWTSQVTGEAGGTDGIHMSVAAPDQPRLVVPIAPSGSGKSTIFKKDFADFTIHSWDTLRIEWYGGDYEEAWRASTMDKQFKSKANSEFSALIKARENVFVDNTNLTGKVRRFYVDSARRAGYHVTAVLLPATIDTVVQRQDTRPDKSVPAGSVVQQYMALQVPSLGEFDQVIVYSGNLR